MATTHQPAAQRSSCRLCSPLPHETHRHVRSASYRVRDAMVGRPVYHDLSGAWVARIVTATDELPAPLTRLGFVEGDHVMLTSTSNAGFRGIEGSGFAPDDDPREFFGVSLGHFEIVDRLQ